MPATLGAAAAGGDAFLFCDADDEVAPGWLAALGRALAVHEFVACRYDNEKLNPAWVQRTHLNPQREGLTAYDYPPFLPHAGGGGLGVRRTVHEAVGGFDESLPALEDTDYCWRIQLAGHGFHFAPDAVVNIRHRHDPREHLPAGGELRPAQRADLQPVPVARHAPPRRSAGGPALGDAPAQNSLDAPHPRGALALALADGVAARAGAGVLCVWGGGAVGPCHRLPGPS